MFVHTYTNTNKINTCKYYFRIKSFIPTYTELVKHAQETQCISQKAITNVETNVLIEESIEEDGGIHDMEKENEKTNMEKQNKAVQEEMYVELTD